jgi:UDPglucose--hexose-1-phosphate uridylyltransferase
VGATISHPHGQIYAFDVVPPRPRAELARHDPTALAPGAAGTRGERLVTAQGGWRAWVPWAATWPYELVVAPDPPDGGTGPADLPGLSPAGRRGLATVLVDCLARYDALFDAPMPYMLWIHQRPFDGGDWPHLPVHVHLAPHLRAPGTARFLAAGEQGAHVMLNTVDPADAAAALRALEVPGP